MLNQGLTTDQIEAMKDANMDGDAIVSALLANSETFETKTEFSKVSGPCPRFMRSTEHSTDVCRILRAFDTCNDLLLGCAHCMMR